MFEYTPYPTKEEYDHVARQIVKKYKFMSDDKGSHVSCLAYVAIAPYQLHIISKHTQSSTKCEHSSPHKYLRFKCVTAIVENILRTLLSDFEVSHSQEKPVLNIVLKYKVH